ncbi:facilitated trehalose transporter Tret1-like [Zootermopsis nevadensis]|uniref:facilitated trehalose transporter Tret1-like n=1 Tax=Zootermopsis nevadensis TaxID=136037 RepID=UPI000B8E9F0E|nr:facilitated trehalose transporter Tret1-like [Zootermopsis nevadensis]
MTANTQRPQTNTVSRFREVLPQVLAMGAANMVVINLTLALLLSTLVIAEVHHSDAELSMDDTLASWFGSLPFFCQPVGSILSGFVVQWLGRKRSLMLINIPYFVGYVLISTAPSITVLFLANVLLGTTVGFTEAPINSYFGEICQPELRSILAGSAAIFYQVGMFVLFVLGSLTTWRVTAGVVAVIPVVTMIMISQVPESPIWLIAQGRLKDAETSLCWLRGWVDRGAYDRVTTKSAQKRADDRETKNLLEEHNMSEYKPSPELNGFLSDNQATKQATSDNAQLPSCEDNTDPTMREVALEMKNIAGHDENQRMISPVDKQITIEKELSTEVFTAEVSDGGRKSKFVTMVKLLVQPETLRPLFLTVSFFSFYGFGGMPSIRPFLVEVIDNFHTPIKGSWSSVAMAVTGFLGSVVMIGSVNRLGKRSLAMSSVAVCALSCLLLGVYDYLFVDRATWVPLVLFTVFSFANSIQGQIPWLLVAEAFPFRTRGLAGGMAAASNYIASFIAAKTFLSTEHSLQMYGSFWFFGVVNCLCFAFLYFLLPETEGKSLEEIEHLFAGNKDHK